MEKYFHRRQSVQVFLISVCGYWALVWWFFKLLLQVLCISVLLVKIGWLLCYISSYLVCYYGCVSIVEFGHVAPENQKYFTGKSVNLSPQVVESDPRHCGSFGVTGTVARALVGKELYPTSSQDHHWGLNQNGYLRNFSGWLNSCEIHLCLWS